jgi:hypothetical protein
VKKTLAIGLALFVGAWFVVSATCSTSSSHTSSSPAPAATLSLSTLPAAAAKSVPPQDENDRRPAAPPKPVPARPDPRTPAQNAAAACTGPNGENRCPQVKRLLGEPSSSPIVPASWTVPNWYIDFANNLGCASDQNSGTSATCTGGCAGSVCTGGIGPLLTAGEWLQHRLGTRSPKFTPSTGTTTLTILSSQPSVSDSFGNFSPDISAGMFVMQGVFLPVGSTFSAGAITQISRSSSGNDFKVAGMPGGAAAGQILYDSTIATVGSGCYIDSIAGGVATCTSPHTWSALTTPSVSYTATANGASWTAGDTLQLYTVPTIYADVVSAQSGGLSASLSLGNTWIQSLNFGDSYSSNGASITTIKTYGRTILSLVSFSSFVIIDGYDNGGIAFIYPTVASCFAPYGAELIGGADVWGGSFNVNNANSTTIRDGALLNHDLILHGTTTVFIGWNQVFNAHLAGTNVVVEPGGSLVMRAPPVAGVLWGAAQLQVYSAASVVNRTSPGTYTTEVLLGGLALTAFLTTTGSAYNDPTAGLWTNGISLTSANIDTFNGLSDPVSGARFSN